MTNLFKFLFEPLRLDEDVKGIKNKLRFKLKNQNDLP